MEDMVDLKTVCGIFKVTFYSSSTLDEVVFIIADNFDQCLAKAKNYQKNYGCIKDWPMTHIELISSTFIK